MRIFVVTVTMRADESWPFYFIERAEADKFRDHLVDLYGFDKNDTLVIEDITLNYDRAIEIFVGAFGPSEEE